MEINTVVISLDRLKELELAEKKLKEPRNKTVIIGEVYYDRYFVNEQGHHYSKPSYILSTDDECAEKLANDLKISREREEKISIKYNLCVINNDSLMNKLSNMSIWKFIKWRKVNN